MSLVKWGTFAFEPNEANLVRKERSSTISPRGFKIIDVHRFTLEVVVKKDSAAAITSRVQQIEAAFASNYQDLNLYTDDAGTVLSAHYLPNSTSLSGVRVVRGPVFDRADGSEYAAKRTALIVLEATYDVSDSDLVSWQDSIRFIGTGGPDYAIVGGFGGVSAFPLGAATPQIIIRSGKAVGFFTWVSPPGVSDLGLSGNVYLPATQQQEWLGSGQCLGNAFRFYPSSWDYVVYCGSPQFVFPRTR